MTRHDDSQELCDRLNDDVEGIIVKYWPGAQRATQKGKAVSMLTPRVKKKGNRATSSFIVHLQGADRGKWYRFSQGVGGFGIHLLFYSVHDRLPDGKEDWATAFRLAREHLGIVEERQESDEDRRQREERRAREAEKRRADAERAAAEEAKRKETRKLTAKEVWQETAPLAGSHGDAYLQARGLPPVSEWPWDCSTTIRFHPKLEYELDKSAGNFPAIIARAQDFLGDGVGLWRVYLDRKEPMKADVVSAKVGLGPVAGGAVRIGGDGPHIGIGEGLETCLAAWALENYRFPVWAGLSTSGMSGFEPPIFVERISIYPDGDYAQFGPNNDPSDPPGMKAAKTLAERMRPTGLRTTINDMCLHGDALDLLRTRTRYDS